MDPARPACHGGPGGARRLVGIGVSWICVISAEMISGEYGVGYRTWQDYTIVDYPGVFVGMATIGLLGRLTATAVELAGRRLVRWLPHREGSQAPTRRLPRTEGGQAPERALPAEASYVGRAPAHTGLTTTGERA
ncbi:hypothetical protein HEK616_38910 [Streptomyces nigrescens]|uniref:Uncharacterized protein n=1 Tax=Streptomyces nigrescens TaxID=1920 RepID=A0ABN6QW40_STRNI|nr:hypothetical protein HEK616_38910 [Streptomyces nigrescens]